MMKGLSVFVSELQQRRSYFTQALKRVVSI